MTRTVSDAAIKSRSDRDKLDIRYTPYWHAIDEHVHLGYRKGPKGGKWLARIYRGSGRYERMSVGTADDRSKPDGVTVLSFDQAARRARELALQKPTGPLLVREALAQYVQHLRATKRNPRAAPEAALIFTANVPAHIQAKAVAALSMREVEKMRDDIVERVADPAADDGKRRARATSNRYFAVVRAALNRAARDPDHGLSDAAWRHVRNFRGVDGTREVFLDLSQQRWLINVCSGGFRSFVIAALLTGARPPHELAGLRVRHFNADTGTLDISGKTGRRTTHLSNEAVAFFGSLAAGREPDDFLLTQDSGSPWRRNSHLAPMRAAVKKAQLPAATVPYSLRHSHISQALLNGHNLSMLAKNVGTSALMIEKVYGKFLGSSLRDEAERAAPKLDLQTSNIVRMAKK